MFRKYFPYSRTTHPSHCSRRLFSQSHGTGNLSIQTGKQTGTGRQAGRQACRQTDRQRGTNRLADIHADRQTARQAVKRTGCSNPPLPERVLRCIDWSVGASGSESAILCPQTSLTADRNCGLVSLHLGQNGQKPALTPFDGTPYSSSPKLSPFVELRSSARQRNARYKDTLHNRPSTFSDQAN